MKYLSVCSGIEAATIAWHPLGWSPVAFAEIEKFPSAVLAHHYPQVPNLGDMTRFKDWPDAAIDVLVGGTPCQSFSVAGLRKGMADPRGNLALVYLAIADRFKPSWLLWENVPGVLSSNEGRDFGAFLGGLAELGYGWAYRVLDAQYVRVDGFARAVPQRRRRVFVVGHLGDWRRAAAVLFERESLLWDSAPRRQAGQRVASTTSYGIDSDCYDRSGEGADKSAGARSGLGIQSELSSALRAKRPNAVAFGGNNTAGPVEVATACQANGSPHGRLDFASETFIASPLVPEIAVTLTRGAESAGKGGYAGRRREDDQNLIAFDTPIPLQEVNGRKSKNQNGVGIGGQQHGIAHGWAVRRLTPCECERLQGFPDNYTAIPKAADGPRYKALGNSMAVNVMRWLGGRIALTSSLLSHDNIRG